LKKWSKEAGSIQGAYFTRKSVLGKKQTGKVRLKRKKNHLSPVGSKENDRKYVFSAKSDCRSDSLPA
jgi:hypothetical protein